jgi:hypothetical protein
VVRLQCRGRHVRAGESQLCSARRSPGWIDSIPGGTLGGAARFGLLAVAVFGVLHGATAIAWSAWRDRENRRAAGAETGANRVYALLFGSLVAVSIGVTLTAGIWDSRRNPAPDDAMGLVLVTSMLLVAVGWSWGGFRPRPLPQRLSPPADKGDVSPLTAEKRRPGNLGRVARCQDASCTRALASSDSRPTRRGSRDGIACCAGRAFLIDVVGLSVVR